MQVRALSEDSVGRRRPARRESVLDLIGHTTLVRLNRVTAGLSEGVEVWVKLEFMNPSGSIKDRAARQIIEDALERGDLADGRRLVDGSSGYTGVALAMAGAATGVPVTIMMPTDAPALHRGMIECYGGTIVDTPVEDGLGGARAAARAFAQEDAGSRWFADHVSNPSNALAYELQMAPEIWSQTRGQITHFVCGVGTGGTITGAARGLLAEAEDLGVFAVRPAAAEHELSALSHPGEAQAECLDSSLLDGTIACSSADARAMATRLMREEGLPASASAGANVWAALQVASGLTSGLVVTVVCDHVDRE